MSTAPFRQLFYTSRCAPCVDIDAIVQQSRHNNAVDGITGLLWHEGDRFLQVLEGPQASVAATYARIAADPRHGELTILTDRKIADREFGYWSMECIGRDGGDEVVRERLARRLEKAPMEIRAVFATAMAERSS